MALPPTVLSLFSGGGGLDLGLHSLGFRTVGYVEREAYAAACLVARMEEASVGRAPVWDDVTSFDGRPWRGVVDCVAGGSPCQDLSVAGKRAGLDGERSGLFWQFKRIVEECQPGLVFWENVGGAVDALPRVAEAFEELGYTGAVVKVRASDVGAPHQRARFFLLAYRDGDGLALLRGLGLLDGERAAQRDDADGRNEGLADAECLGREVAIFPTRGRLETDTDGQAGIPGVLCGVVADADSAAGWLESGRCCGACRPSAAVAGDVGGAVGHTACGGMEGYRPGRVGIASASAGQALPRCAGHEFPPTRDDAAGWADYLARGGPAPSVARVRRGVDGLADGLVDSCWADRLRLLGNGVVPAQAAAAFTFLARSLR